MVVGRAAFLGRKGYAGHASTFTHLHLLRRAQGEPKILRQSWHLMVMTEMAPTLPSSSDLCLHIAYRHVNVRRDVHICRQVSY